MVFAWDEEKDRTNQRKHGLSFELASRVFLDPTAVSYPDRTVEGEERWHTIGMIGSVAIILVVHTSEERDGKEKIRIISARKATPSERNRYHSAQ